MARSSRQSKILELISIKEIDTQDELAKDLKNAGFEITQATISRDIKELGITKILSSSGKYKYAILESQEKLISNKYINILRESVISVKPACNLVVVKTLKGTASSVASFIDKFNFSDLVGVVNGDDTVMLIFPNSTLSVENSRAFLDVLG